MRSIQRCPNGHSNSGLVVGPTKALLCVLALTACSSAFAEDDHIIVDAGLGIFSTEGKNLSQGKFAKFGLQQDIWYNLKQRYNVGAWLDSRDQQYKSSAFAGYQLGFQVDNDTYESSVFFGPNLITTPDAALGGHFQFNLSIFFGIKDRDGNAIGFGYNHFSSAGIEMPNLGRDYGCLEIKF